MSSIRLRVIRYPGAKIPPISCRPEELALIQRLLWCVVHLEPRTGIRHLIDGDTGEILHWSAELKRELEPYGIDFDVLGEEEPRNAAGRRR